MDTLLDFGQDSIGKWGTATRLPATLGIAAGALYITTTVMRFPWDRSAFRGISSITAGRGEMVKLPLFGTFKSFQ